MFDRGWKGDGACASLTVSSPVFSRKPASTLWQLVQAAYSCSWHSSCSLHEQPICQNWNSCCRGCRTLSTEPALKLRKHHSFVASCHCRDSSLYTGNPEGSLVTSTSRMQHPHQLEALIGIPATTPSAACMRQLRHEGGQRAATRTASSQGKKQSKKQVRANEHKKKRFCTMKGFACQ